MHSRSQLIARNTPETAAVLTETDAAASAPTPVISEALMDDISRLSHIEQLIAFMRYSTNAGIISDLHIGSNQEPWVTIDNEGKRLPRLNDIENITDQEVSEFIDKSFSESERKELYSSKRMYGTTSRHDDIYGAVRIHAMHTTDGINLIIRLLNARIPNLKELGLDEDLEQLTKYRNGLIIFTGATGSGKSTSVAALIDMINEQFPYIIYCIEDPIEYVHTNKKSRIKQISIGKEIASYHEGLRSLLRAAPHVIFVGEMRDAETMRAAIAAAETSHLVISTMHCNTPTEAVQRLVGSFDAAQAQEIQAQFAYVMRAIVGQRLVPRADGKGRVAATEILINTPAIKRKILQGELNMLRAEVSTGKIHGMHTLEDNLTELARKGIITPEIANRTADQKEEIRLT